MKTTILLICILMLSACGELHNSTGEKPQMVGDASMRYFKDLRTNICFATIGADARTLTSVPCTAEVEAIIKVNGK